MKTKKLPVPIFDNAVDKFMADNLNLCLEYNCEALLNIANKLLISRTADEILDAEHFVNTILIEQTDVVDLLNKTLDDRQIAGHRGFKNGNNYEYFAVLTALLARKMQPWAKASVRGELSNDGLTERISWATSQANKSVEIALEGHVDFLFPGRQDDLFGLLNLALTELVRRGISDCRNTIYPVLEPMVKRLFAVPGFFDAIKAGISELKQHTKSEAAGKAGSQKGKNLAPQQEFAIEEYKAKKNWDSRSHAARVILNRLKKKYPDVKLSKNEDGEERKIRDWISTHPRVQIRSAILINRLRGQDALASEPLDRQVKVAKNELHTSYPRRTIPDCRPPQSRT